MPRPAEIEVEEWAAPNGSYSLSLRLVKPAGQDLVWIGLVANVPDNTIMRGIEDVMERNGQFDNAKSRAEMSTGGRNRIDQFGPQLLRQLRQVGFRQLAQIRRDFHAIKQRCFKILGQSAGSSSKLNSSQPSLKENSQTSKKRTFVRSQVNFRARV
jgi:hypothetical protein